MERKGQIEFIVILGLLVVIAVVVFYSYQSGILGPVISPDVSLAEESVNGLVRAAAYETLNNMSLYGGYLNADSFALGSITFNGREVPYWQKNGQVNHPDLHSNFREGVKSYIIKNKDAFGNAYTEEYGKELVLGNPSVSANFFNDKIELLVNMPTTLDGAGVPQPYTLTIQTRFEEIKDFSNNYLTFAGSNRPLEYFTLGTVLFSPIKDGEHDVPLYIHLTECGEVLYKDWFDIKSGMEYAIKTTLAHTYMPGKYPQNVLHTTSHPKYSIPPLNGKEYEDVDVSFHLPDDFELDQNTLQFIPNPIYAQAELIPMTSICQSNPMFVKYFLMYPAIVRVKDPLTENIFQFATEVFVYNNTPGDWGADGYQPSSFVCENSGCNAEVTVKDSSGNPISGATITFMDCLLGRTDSSGSYSGAAPCGIGPLDVYRQGYGTYSDMYSIDELDDVSVTLYGTPGVNLHLYEVHVQNLSITNQYLINEGGVNYVNTKHTNQFVHMSFYSYVDNQLYQMFFEDKVGRITHIPSGNYYISGTLITDEVASGEFIYDYALTEDLDGKDLYIYVPYIDGFGGDLDDEVKYMEGVQDMTRLLEECGLGPIRDTPAEDFKGCVVGYNEL